MAAKKKAQAKGGGAVPSVQDIVSDSISKLSLEHWAGGAEKASFDAKLVEQIYKKELWQGPGRVVLLELSRYLENYLWPFFSEKSSRNHLLSIVLLVNEKCRENVSAWDCFSDNPEKFQQFFKRLLALLVTPKRNSDGEGVIRTGREAIRLREKHAVICFLINCTHSLEQDLVSAQILRLVSLPMWVHLPSGKRSELVEQNSSIQKRWKYLKKQEQRQSSTTKGGKDLPVFFYEKHFVWTLICDFCAILSKITPESAADSAGEIRYCEKFLEWMVDLLGQQPTRRFFRVVLEASMLAARASVAPLRSAPEGKVLSEMVERVLYYMHFEVDDFTGGALTSDEVMERHYERIQHMQLTAFRSFQEQLKAFALCNVGAIESTRSLKAALSLLSDEQIVLYCQQLNLMDSNQEIPPRDVLIEHVVDVHAKRLSQQEIVSDLPIYPTEGLLWDEQLMALKKSSDGVSGVKAFSGHSCLPIAKLGLQFLTMQDYLMRNFSLLRLEASYAIRQHLEDVLKRMAPRKDESGSTVFTGWSTMGLDIRSFAVKHAGAPRIGERSPSQVIAEVSINLKRVKEDARREWEELKQHDILFLVCSRPDILKGQGVDNDLTFPERYGIKAVRGCEVLSVVGRDDEGKAKFDGGEGRKRRPRGGPDTMILRVLLDPSQYRIDLDGGLDKIYSREEGFNVLVRRRTKENNFKAVLESVRGMMGDVNNPHALPEWLTDSLLGYGDPTACSYVKHADEIDFLDTFLDEEHLRECFEPATAVELSHDDTTVSWLKERQERPYLRLSFTLPEGEEDNDRDGSLVPKAITAKEYRVLPSGPYDQQRIQQNTIRFTPTQVEAIRSGVSEGLTMVVGPPGTGKTDVAVQITNLLYHNFPQQRILLITHSNQALNQIFEKLVALDIDERHMLRLGHGEKQLDTEASFSRVGRVDFMLERRLELLSKVSALALSLSLPDDAGYTCQTAGLFFQHQIEKRWKEFNRKVIDDEGEDAISVYFPFTEFFTSEAGGASATALSEGTDDKELFTKERSNDTAVAESCYRYLVKIFSELEAIQPFELLRTSRDRTNYLLTNQAKIVAMTCTHAALRRKELIALGFSFSSLVMEEAAQVLDIEALTPLMCRSGSATVGGPTAATAAAREPLRRVVLIGDHNQLPPVIQNRVLQQYSHLDQSLFARLVRLGVRTVQLDMQGRCRKELANLFRWRYQNLNDLPAVGDGEYLQANAGFAHCLQMINVEDYNGQGELEPNPHFFQNLGEAEYLVATYQYMRLLGYPSEKITVLTTYNGQKHLIRDVLNQRCRWNPLFGLPSKVTTVDRFQGQQNDYILLSLVRTKNVGHVRDVRRLVVAMSRARLGLYMFCRQSLFENCYELTEAFARFRQKPSSLQLIPGERYPTTRKMSDDTKEGVVNVLGLADLVPVLKHLSVSLSGAFQPQSVSVAPARTIAAAPDEDVEME